jgi:hypothetical protein
MTGEDDFMEKALDVIDDSCVAVDVGKEMHKKINR